MTELTARERLQARISAGHITWDELEKATNALLSEHARVNALQEADVQRVKDISRLTIERDQAREERDEARRLLAEMLQAWRKSWPDCSAMNTVAEQVEAHLGHR